MSFYLLRTGGVNQEMRSAHVGHISSWKGPRSNDGMHPTANQQASHRELVWFRGCVRGGYPKAEIKYFHLTPL
jgi:hypothetical protein